jgi:hypothetical protein
LGLKDEVLSELKKSRAPVDEPDETSQPIDSDPEPVKAETQQLSIVKGDLAKAMAPSMGNKPSLKVDVMFQVEKQKKGYPPAKPLVLADPDEVEAVKNRPKSLADDIRGEIENQANPLKLGVDDPKSGFAFLGSSFTKGGEKSATSEDVQRKATTAVHGVLTALSMDEHLIVKGLSKATGMKDKADISDYTWTNYLRDLRGDKPKETFGDPRLGFPASVDSDQLLNAMGLTSSIVLSPSTYVTFGNSTAAKVGLKTALTKEGQKLVSQIAKETAEKQIAERAAKLGVELSPEAANALRQQAKFDTEQQVLRKFGEINSYNKDINVSVSVTKLPDRVKSAGGVKYEIPFTGREVADPIYTAGKKLYDAASIKFYGKEVLRGEEIAKEMADSGLTKYTEVVLKNKKLKELTDDAKSGVDFLGKSFIVDYGVDRNLVNYFRRAGDDAEKLLGDVGSKKYKQADVEMAYMTSKWEEAEAEAVNASRIIKKGVEKSFSYLNKEQKTEFMDTLIRASTESEQTKVYKDVFAKSKDPKVQDAIDRWVGQGRFADRKSTMEKLAEKSRITEGERIAIWVPGIIEEMAEKRSLKISKDLNKAERDFLKARIDPAEAERYTRDPVKAIGHRLTEISYANIQDKFFDNMVAKKLGGLTDQFKSMDEALDAGYVPMRRPLHGILAKNGDLAKRVNEPTYYVRQEFAAQYNSLVKNQGAGPILSGVSKYLGKPTALWKQHVTGIFPSFHAGNFGSNIIMNSMRIGGHAIEPNKFLGALEATMKRGMEKEPKGLADKIYHGAVGIVFGKGMDRAYTTAIGETMTIKSIIKEAETIGAIKKGMYQADISGATITNKSISEVLGSNLTKYANPLSREWVPSVFGQKFGEAIETQSRLVNYMTWRMKGLSPRAAAFEVNEALFDYSKITGTEKALNSSIIPFYTFSRKNIENHVRIFGHRPGAITTQLKFFRELAPTEEEMQNMPEWARKRFVSKVRGEFYTNFRIPMEDMMDLVEEPEKQAVLRANPFLRYAGEKLIDKDTFSNRNIEEVNNANEFKLVLDIADSKNTPEFIKKGMSEIRNWLKLEYDPAKPDKVIGDPDKLHFLRSSFSSRYQSVVGQLSKEDKEPYEKAIRFITGVVKIEEDPGLALSIKKKETIAKAQDKLLRTNTARPFPMVYYFGKGPGPRLANKYMEAIKDAKSTQEIDMRTEGLFEMTEDFQKARVGIDD